MKGFRLLHDLFRPTRGQTGAFNCRLQLLPDAQYLKQHYRALGNIASLEFQVWMPLRQRIGYRRLATCVSFTAAGCQRCVSPFSQKIGMTGRLPGGESKSGV